jgi:hypothetical protein
VPTIIVLTIDLRPRLMRDMLRMTVLLPNNNPTTNNQKNSTQKLCTSSPAFPQLISQLKFSS